MLKGIPRIISPELMKVLLEMGHGDEIVLADGNFPAASHTNNVVRCDGHHIPELLEAILLFFPLDTFVEKPVTVMKPVGNASNTPAIWEEYKECIKKYDLFADSFEMVERYEFYEQAKKAYAIIATSESALYVNIILKKGVIQE